MNRRCFLTGIFASVALAALAALAHVGPTILYEKVSRFNTIVVMEEAVGLRTLRFGKDGVRQSAVKLGDPDHLALPYYQEVFDELFILDVRGSENKILLVLPRKQPLSRDELTQLARKVSAARRFLFDLGDPVKYGLQDARTKSQHERVLRDRDPGQPKSANFSK